MIAPRRVEQATTVATVAVVASVAVALAGLTWRIVAETDGRSRVAIAEPPAAAARASIDTAAILRLAPFGAAVANPTATASANATLVLRGVLLAAPPAASAALIAANGGESVPYGVGDALAGGGVVESIAFDHVLLRNGGQLERLGFPQVAVAQSAGAAAIRALIPASVSGVASSGSAGATGGATGGGASTPSAALPPADSAAAIESYRARVADNPQSLLDSLGATATPGGYRVGPTPSPEMRRAGLLPGDVIESVNGVKVGDVETDRGLFDSAVTSGRARVEVVRDGKRMAMSFPLR